MIILWSFEFWRFSKTHHFKMSTQCHWPEKLTWLGYEPSESSWQARSHKDCTGLLEWYWIAWKKETSWNIMKHPKDQQTGTCSVLWCATTWNLVGNRSKGPGKSFLGCNFKHFTSHHPLDCPFFIKNDISSDFDSRCAESIRQELRRSVASFEPSPVEFFAVRSISRPSPR